MLQQQRHTPQSPVSNWADIPPEIRRRLERENVRSPDDWRALGRRRHRLFGIVPSVIRMIDDLTHTVRS